MPFAADALRPLVNKLLSQDESGQNNDQLKALSQLSPSDIEHSATAFCRVFPDLLRTLQQELHDSFVAQSKTAAAVAREPSNFWGLTASCGSVADFHKGLSGCVGMPQLNFKIAMRQEHCERAGCDVEFTTNNYHITTTPKNEWNYVVNGVAPPFKDMGEGRCIVPIDELYQKEQKWAKEGTGLTEVELIAVVLYTGPMFQVYNGILRRWPEEFYKVFASDSKALSSYSYSRRYATLSWYGWQGGIARHFLSSRCPGLHWICRMGVYFYDSRP
jgi:hypothetical protein